MKHQVKKDRFLDWYFSSDEDIMFIGSEVKDSLELNGSYGITVDALFNGAGYIPSWICVGEENNTEEYNPNECELID